MVDYLSLAISHAVLMLAVWRLLWREDLDADPPAASSDIPASEPDARA